MRKILAVSLILLAVSLACSFSGSGNLPPSQNTPIPATEKPPAVKILVDVETTSISTVTALKALWVREAAGHDQLPVGVLLANDTVILLGACDADGWRLVQTTDGSLIGWVNADYLDQECQ